jgi:hypothetical protein
MQRTINPMRRFAPTVVLALIVVAAFGAGAAGAAGAGKAGPRAEAFVPGITDFPSRLGEVGERSAEARLARRSQEVAVNEFAPGVTDFPSRLGEIGERAAVARLAQASQQAVTVEESGFDWSAGATGAIAATLLLLGAALAVRTAKRSRLALG